MRMHDKLLLVLGLLVTACLAHSAERAHPNVVIIYGDDVGYGDVGVYGAEMIPTPRIDQLASEGIRFRMATARLQRARRRASRC